MKEQKIPTEAEINKIACASLTETEIIGFARRWHVAREDDERAIAADHLHRACARLDEIENSVGTMDSTMSLGQSVF
jgi:hypothetical protein